MTEADRQQPLHLGPQARTALHELVLRELRAAVDGGADPRALRATAAGLLRDTARHVGPGAIDPGLLQRANDLQDNRDEQLDPLRRERD